MMNSLICPAPIFLYIFLNYRTSKLSEAPTENANAIYTMEANIYKFCFSVLLFTEGNEYVWTHCEKDTPND